ncbi:MAG: hypothetical protein O6948_14070 [Deltaproteobacteria bacterium]|nr:hypothetical protein [Deltaproteobacteria bacterium]
MWDVVPAHGQYVVLRQLLVEILIRLRRGSTQTPWGAARYSACMAAALAGHPGLAGWYTADERKADEAKRVFHQYTILRSAAPGGITFISQNRPQELLRWRDAVDVMGVDPYPIFGNYPNDFPEPPLAPLEMVTDYSKALVTAIIAWALSSETEKTFKT